MGDETHSVLRNEDCGIEFADGFVEEDLLEESGGVCGIGRQGVD